MTESTNYRSIHLQDIFLKIFVLKVDKTLLTKNICEAVTSLCIQGCSKVEKSWAGKTS